MNREPDNLSSYLFLALASALSVAAVEPRTINGLPVDPERYWGMIEHGFLPARTNFLSDVEIAQKLDLDLPELAPVKAAVEKNDAPALTKALIAYLNRKLPPLKPDDPPKPAPHNDSPKVWQRPDAWLGKEITFIVNDQPKTYTVGAGINWFICGDGEPDIKGWSWWGNCLTSAYLATGDPKYARGVLTYAQSFYQNCRPPVEFRRPIYWSGVMGPWAIGGAGRADGFMQWMYRAIAGAPVMTDADRLMFLKMFYEHGETMYRFAEEHRPHNFEFYPILVLARLAQNFPEFKDGPAWRARSIERVLQNLNDCVLEDGGAYERTTYNFGYLSSYTRIYRQLREAGAPLPDAFRRKLETMYDWGIWVASPLHQYPNLNIGTFSDVSGYLEPASELFPDRADLLYWVSNGAKGKPPERTAKVLFQTGFLTMRSDWSRDALYMAMNYNGSLPEVGTYPDLLSFGLWAHGRIYMSNAGTPVSYAHPMLKEWCTQTRASNTVEVDGQSQTLYSNSGRLESWQDLPGYTYLAAVADNYRHLDVQHRRAVLFLKQRHALSGVEGYWLVYDRLIPTAQPGKVHEYRWQGHFQPMELTIDPATKTVASSVVAGKRLYLVPANPAQFELQRGKGLISDGVHASEEAVEGPYISLIQKSGQPVSFTVLLFPTTNNAPAPLLSSLKIQAGKEGVPTDNATGIQIRQGRHDDVVTLADKPGFRVYGPLTTDGEAAYVRNEGGKTVEAGLVGGQKLIYSGKTLIEVGPEIASADIHYASDQITVEVRGNGKISMPAGSEKTLALNGTALSVGKKGWWWKRKWEVALASPGLLEISAPTFSTDRAVLWKAVAGNPPPAAIGPRPAVLVRWKTSRPSDALIEYAPDGTDDWLRTMNPEPHSDHWFVLSHLTPETTYQLRITCRTDDGRVANTQVTYPFEGVK
ncbi:MAG: heparinase II/III family protein [Verrucomicrobia bacterium]|nr:heparinase II/III family protein [Verrucomicrobiota bacterium]